VSMRRRLTSECTRRAGLSHRPITGLFTMTSVSRSADLDLPDARGDHRVSRCLVQMRQRVVLLMNGLNPARASGIQSLVQRKTLTSAVVS